MKYLSIEIQPTLESEVYSDFVELAIVYDDTESSVSDAESFSCFCDSGELYLPWSTSIVSQYDFTNFNKAEKLSYDHAFSDFMYFLFSACGVEDGEKLCVVSSGFQSTISVLENAFGEFGWGEKIAPYLYTDRLFDPMSCFIEQIDQYVPNLETCLVRAGLPSDIEFYSSTNKSLGRAIALTSIVRYTLDCEF